MNTDSDVSIACLKFTGRKLYEHIQKEDNHSSVTRMVLGREIQPINCHAVSFQEMLTRDRIKLTEKRYLHLKVISLIGLQFFSRGSFVAYKKGGYSVSVFTENMLNKYVFTEDTAVFNQCKRLSENSYVMW